MSCKPFFHQKCKPEVRARSIHARCGHRWPQWGDLGRWRASDHTDWPSHRLAANGRPDGALQRSRRSPAGGRRARSAGRDRALARKEGGVHNGVPSVWKSRRLIHNPRVPGWPQTGRMASLAVFHRFSTGHTVLGSCVGVKRVYIACYGPGSRYRALGGAGPVRRVRRHDAAGATPQRRLAGLTPQVIHKVWAVC